ncbi:DUF721 domain-containing protein [Gracilinema caldarium]|uniref:DUF721 domain-containing protein n=1 Tax=Gracilinema caldarium (strain ATCC 51460 / DSM 7334 / H1) TaxID=744872 RepID=F8EWL3_GRAC1|nr:DUF721 domain-containing protein [Gracilinema caldarium]AEJ18176.1 protein of unknown function DUF721 [Gracilinema caldarium DSM 7334]
MRKAGDILSAFFDERLSKKGQTYSALFKSWQQIAGDQISAHSRIVELERNILFVEADHPGWIMILQSKEQDLLNRVRRSFPDLIINGISFRLSKMRGSTQNNVDENTMSKVSVNDNSLNSEVVLQTQELSKPNYERIQDPQFREALMRLEQSIRSRHT